MLGGEVGGRAARLVVDDKIDGALPIQRDVLRSMVGNAPEPHHLERRFEDIGDGRRELDELEAHQPHRIFE